MDESLGDLVDEESGEVARSSKMRKSSSKSKSSGKNGKSSSKRSKKHSR